MLFVLGCVGFLVVFWLVGFGFVVCLVIFFSDKRLLSLARVKNLQLYPRQPLKSHRSL